MKTLGQVAHEAGEKHGHWLRKWDHMADSQKAEWESIARVVANQTKDSCCGIVFGQCSSDNEAQRIVDAIRATKEPE